ncbi:MAG TPA: response regulator [Xanthobacteraceae bacterium]|nr:response regulator [Xanthobacteraceae bacterium]
MNRLTSDRFDDATRPLAGARLLVVEDEVLVAMEIEELIGELGAEVVGPFGRIADALDALRRESVTGAVLDIKLDGDTTLPLVDILRARGFPVLFVTGGAPEAIPESYRQLPRLSKPFDHAELADLARSIFGRP